MKLLIVVNTLSCVARVPWAIGEFYPLPWDVLPILRPSVGTYRYSHLLPSTPWVHANPHNPRQSSRLCRGLFSKWELKVQTIFVLRETAELVVPGRPGGFILQMSAFENYQTWGNQPPTTDRDSWYSVKKFQTSYVCRPCTLDHSLSFGKPDCKRKGSLGSGSDCQREKGVRWADCPRYVSRIILGLSLFSSIRVLLFPLGYSLL